MVKRAAYQILSLFWLMLLVWAGYETASKGNVYSTLFARKGAVTNRISEAKTSIIKSCWHHDEMVDLYGGWARLMDQHRCNGEVKCAKAYLTYPLHEQNVLPIVSQIIKLKDFIEARGAKFLYVQCPYKNSLTKSIVPDGAGKDCANAIADTVLANLKVKGLEILDLRPEIVCDEETLQKYYFRTDHHWNFDGAMKTFPSVAEELQKLLSVRDNISFFTSTNNWVRRDSGRTFLGSQGRRTGILFAGADKLFYYTPNFRTDILSHVYNKDPGNYSLRKGPFEYSVCLPWNLASPVSHFVDSGYSYYNQDKPLIRYRNQGAPINRKLLVLKDSYGLPLVAFLSTVFESVDVLDFRHYNEMSLGDYVRINKPDCLCMIYNPGALSMSQKFWHGCGVDLSVHKPQIIFEKSEFEITKSPSNYNYTPVATNLQNGTGYLVSVHQVDATPDFKGCVTIGVCDDSRGRLVSRGVIGTQCEDDNLYMRCPTKGGPYSLVIYAGEQGATRDVQLRCKGISVEKCAW